MKKLYSGISPLLPAVLFLTAALVDTADAIPVFARKYATTCMTCHATFPRLTAVGEAFKLNGYQLPAGDDLYTKDKSVSMGSESYKTVFPQAVWPSDIPQIPPIALRVINDIEYNTGHIPSGQQSRWKMTAPSEVELLSMGTFGDSLSFHLALQWEPDDTNPGNTVSSYDGWLMWKNIAGKHILNMKVGTVGAREIALPNAQQENSFTIQEYLYSEQISGGLDGPGLEFNGFGKNWRYAAGLVKPQNVYSNESYYVQGSLKFGGVGYDGSGGTSAEGVEGGLNTAASGYWRGNSLHLGGFYYRDSSIDKLDRYGIDARCNYLDASLAVGWVKLDNRLLSDSDKNVTFVEIEYFVFPWLQPFARYEVLSADAPDSDLERIALGTVFLVRANVKVNLEGKFYTKNRVVEAAGVNKNVDDRILARLDLVF